MKDPAEHIRELKSALADAIQTIELGASVLGKQVVAKKLEQFRALTAVQAPLITESNEKAPQLRLYVDQLEGLARRVLAEGGTTAAQARLILSPENMKSIGLAPGRPITGKFRLVELRPSLKERCTATPSGQHQTFQEGKRLYCRACGVEGMVKADGTL